jgi:hypothetical protein
MFGESGAKTARWSIRQSRAREEQRFNDFEAYKNTQELERSELAGIYEDETTWLAETLNGSMRSRFTFKSIDGELTAQDGRQLRGIFENSKERAKKLAARDPRMKGEVVRADIEWEEFLLMDYMANNPDSPNTLVVNSAILDGLTEDAHGYQATRGLGWSRVITRNDTTGEIIIASQSLDGDERQAYNAIYEYFGHPAPDTSVSNDYMLGVRIAVNLTAEEQAALPDVIMGIYDGVMDLNHGTKHRAGRSQNEARGDTWQFTLTQTDLVKDHIQKIAPYVLLQKQGNQDESVAASAKAIRYSTAAMLKRRYELGAEWTNRHQDLAGEREVAGGEAAAAGESFNGCGFNADAPTTAQSQLEALGYGLRRKVKGSCPYCHSTVEYDPCDPQCSECGPYGNDVKKYRQAMGQKALQARRNMIKRKTKPNTTRPNLDKRITLPNGSVMIVKKRLVVGGTSQYYEEKGTGKTIELPPSVNG